MNKNYQIKLIKRYVDEKNEIKEVFVDSLDLKNVDIKEKSIQEKLIRFHNTSRKDFEKVVCACGSSNTIQVVYQNNYYHVRAVNSYTHKENCCFYKDSYANFNIEQKEIKGKLENVYTYNLKKRTKKSEKKEKIDEIDDETITDTKIYNRSKELNSLGSIFSRIINTKYRNNVLYKNIYSFDQFFNGLNYNFERNFIGNESIGDKIKNNEIVFGKVLTIKRTAYNYNIKIKPLNILEKWQNEHVNINKTIYKDGRKIVNNTQYIDLTVEEYEYACEYYRAMNIDISNSLEEYNFYIVGMTAKTIDLKKDKSEKELIKYNLKETGWMLNKNNKLVNKITKNQSKKNIIENAYFLAMTENGLIVDSLFESRMLDKFYEENITKFYKPLKPKYDVILDYDDYPFLADVIVETSKNKYIIEFFGRNDPLYLNEKKIKIAKGNKINENNCFVKFRSIELNDEKETIDSLINELKN